MKPQVHAPGIAQLHVASPPDGGHSRRYETASAPWELVIARDQGLCEGAIFYYFLSEIVQDRARSCRTW